jgi:hypothetical protein
MKQLVLPASLEFHDSPAFQLLRIRLGKLAGKRWMQRTRGGNGLSFHRSAESSHRSFYFG